MEAGPYDKIALCKILYFVGGLVMEWKRWGNKSRSKNGWDARVTLRPHPTYSRSSVDTEIKVFQCNLHLLDVGRLVISFINLKKRHGCLRLLKENPTKALNDLTLLSKKNYK
jgi:hypothetical protein